MKASPTMVAAMDIARQNGGKLTRHQGGFWAGPNWKRGEANAGTQTVDSLVRRGLASYTAHSSNANGQFAVEATLTESALAKLAAVKGGQK